MADDRIEIEVVLDDGSIQKGFAKIRKEGNKTERSLSKNFSKALRADISKPFDVAKKSIFNLRSAVVGLTAVIGSGAFLRTITEAAGQQEDAINALNISLKTAGTFSEEASLSFQKLASELQSQSRFGDEVILQQAALARNYTNSNEQAEKLIKTSLDLAEATGMSLDSAVRNVGKTLSGLTGELGEAVPQVRGLTAEQLKAGAAIDVLAERFGGSALGKIRTFTGAQAQLSNVFGDLLERIGNLITSSPAIVNLFNALSDTLSGLGKNLDPKQFEQFFKDLIINSAAVAGAVVESFSVIAQLPAFFKFTFKSVELELSEALQRILVLLQPLTNVADSLLSAVGLGEVGESQKVLEQNEKFLNGLRSELQLLAEQGLEVDKSFDFVRKAIDDTVIKFQELSVSADSTTKKVSNSFKADLGEVAKTTIETTNELGNAVRNGFARVISSSVQLLAQGLAKGSLNFKEFGKQILGLLGDIAIQIGTTVIAGSKALASLFTGNVAGGIGFGAALVAVGALLKAGASGGISGAAGVPPAQDAITGPIIGDGISDNIDRQASVQVNIEGQILADDDTVGIRIADILKEQGFNNAVVS